MKNNKTNKRQFTLIELIIVIVVIGIIAGMALPKFLGVQRNAKVAAMETDLDVIEKAVMQYVTATDDGSYPFIDVNGDKTINEEDLYFKTETIPQTLTDSLLKASGDDGSKIYKLDMEKLKPYISKIKYPDTEYLYSEKSDTAIDPIGKADGDNFIHHIVGSGNVGDANDSQKNINVVRNKNFVLSSNFISYIGEDGDVYLNGKVDSSTFTKSKMTTNANAIKVFASDSHCAYLDKDGKFFTLGRNYQGQLGRPTGNNADYTFKEAKLPTGVKAVDAALGGTFTIVIGDDGKLYSTGYNMFVESLYTEGKYYLDEFAEFSLPNGKKPKEITSSSNHIVVLDTEGNVHIMGTSGLGYFLGIKPTNCKTFSFENPIVGITTSHGCLFVLDSKGDLYALGDNTYSELGVGDKNKRTEFTKIELEEGISIKSIESMGTFNMLLTTDGDLYGWGSNDYGKFGMPNNGPVLKPVKVQYEGIGKIKTIYSSFTYSLSSFVFEDEKGDLYGIGGNSYNMLWSSGYGVSTMPEKIDLNVKIKK